MPLYPEEMAPICPSCNIKMKERKGKFGPFWGCKNYPKCNATLDFEDFDHSEFPK